MNKIASAIIIGGGAIGTSYHVQSLVQSKSVVIIDDFSQQQQNNFLSNNTPFAIRDYSGFLLNNGSSPFLPFIANGPIYMPKWKKLKYWQPTKKNPKRR